MGTTLLCNEESTNARRRGERAGVLRTVAVSEKDQPMIESGTGTVYEAIVRRKSHPAIWRANRRAARAAAHLAEISACRRRVFRNLGTALRGGFPQTKLMPFKSMRYARLERRNPGTAVA
ncbi:hypothetical protein [Burkholderia multivorans]|uniref:hypothetical protein n=1 Tax=Burkholderia multivorans TaxID=87883 RepID=UPI0012DDEDDA|nr:hypothetical protein [Burkholderia multivorans]MCA8142290.1 hypothetical protein [Burkholderia multivorans]MCO1363244.1 hypothetical protein [Burkholderia multivorans]MCO1379714.1 hypothetical protein [Burkholderia multivorans]QGR63195.1 hypothetical protein FOC27_23770 [Burkholderia multivorans]UQP23367.1 hypothetical protein L0Y98_21160 [Burkholderia multivorans]